MSNRETIGTMRLIRQLPAIDSNYMPTPKPSEFAMKAAIEINRAAVSNDDLFSEKRLASIIDQSFKPLLDSHLEMLKTIRYLRLSPHTHEDLIILTEQALTDAKAVAKQMKGE